jgi:hypothetical protein
MASEAEDDARSWYDLNDSDSEDVPATDPVHAAIATDEAELELDAEVTFVSLIS